jgi:hypothetical protein
VSALTSSPSPASGATEASFTRARARANSTGSAPLRSGSTTEGEIISKTKPN